MNANAVNVLTPNGRRMNIKVQPNTTILKILEDVCSKHKFDPNCYDLKHHNRIMDLSTMYRFSGLPNNAQLEMVDTPVKRQDLEVELMLQLPDGTRLDGTFKPTATVYDILEKLWPTHSTTENVVAIYMRTEIVGEKMRDVSLKDLGLVSGRGLLRLVQRDPDAAKITANVALNLPKVAPVEDVPKAKSTIEASTSTSALLPMTTSSIFKALKAEKDNAQQSDVVPMSVDGSDAGTADVEMESKESIERIGSLTEKPSQDEMVVAEEEEEDDGDDGEAFVLGERNAVVFSLASAKAKMPSLRDLPDSFFDLNVRDIKILMRELRTQIKGTTDQPLLTAQLRELEEDKERLTKLNRYKKSIIRIEFPDRHVLQGTFTPMETIETVMNFVRLYLTSPEVDFYLYTTPPKVILSKEERLFETQCVPSAILHFGTGAETKSFLKADVLEKISSAKACLKVALSDRGLHQTTGGTNSTGGQVEAPIAGTSNATRRSISNAFKTSSSEKYDEPNAPKWFKGFKK